MIHADVLCDSSVALVANAVECEHSSIPDLVWGNSPLGIWDIQNWNLNLSKLEVRRKRSLVQVLSITVTPQVN